MRPDLERWSRLLTRGIAITIAVAGVIDPAVSAMRAPLSPLVVINATVGELPVIDALSGRETEVRHLQGVRVPCAPGERCVVVADGSVDAEIPADLPSPPALIAVTADGPNVAIRSAAIGSAHVGAAAVARVDVMASGMANRDVTVRIHDGAAVVGSVSAKITNDATSIDVPWWPIDAGARHLRIDVEPIAGEASVVDNAIDVGVQVGNTRSRVLVYDTRLSWSSTFVRRALEDDRRFSVDHLSRVAPAISAATPAARLDATTLDVTDAVIIGAPDALTAGDVTLLDRFVRIRGGSLILLPERRPAGPSMQWFTGWIEELAAKPVSIGALRASELLKRTSIGATETAIAAAGSSAIIVATPTGRGRIVVSGAMDAWRYRDLDAGGFDRFWTSLIAEAAAAGAPLMIDFDRDLAASGSHLPFTLRLRTMQAVPGTASGGMTMAVPGTVFGRSAQVLGITAQNSEAVPGTAQVRDEAVPGTAQAVSRCGNEGARAIRLWPAGAIGEFTGDISAGAAGACAVEATVDDRHVTGFVAIADKPHRGAEQTLRRLHAVLSDDLPGPSTASRVATTVHPMQSPWWILPFAGCLSIEWWLRRRAGSA